MPVDHDADIDTDDLVQAMRRIESALAVVGEHPSLLSAREEVQATGNAITDAETFEDKLRQGLDYAYRAEDSVGQYHRFFVAQHREGRLRLSNDEAVYVDACMTDAADALSRWVDYAVNELRQIAA